MSAVRGKPEATGCWAKPTRMMWWTTPTPGIECAKGVIV
jgi:hypothetical protein